MKNNFFFQSEQVTQVKGGLISGSFSFWLQSPKKRAKSRFLTSIHLERRCSGFFTYFGEIGANVKNFLRLSHLYTITFLWCMYLIFFHELKKMTFHKYWQITIGHQRGSLWRVKSKHQLVFQTCSCIGSALWAFVIKQNILWNAINHISW